MNILITGANSGLGFVAAKTMAKKGHCVIMAVRNLEKGNKALQEIKNEYPNADIHLMSLNLASLESIRSFAEAFQQEFDHLDVLCNNAGVMVPPFQKTTDGFELQIGTNHLGHFALTGLLLPSLLKSSSAKVITTSSVAKWFGCIRFNTFSGNKKYHPWMYYGQSKYANYLFFKQLQDFFDENVMNIRSIGCHPGIAQTNLTSRGTGVPSKGLDRMWNIFGQAGKDGALTLIEAIENNQLKGKDYIIPDGFMQFKGQPKIGKHLCRRYCKKTALALWKKSEELTGVHFSNPS